ncbi:hypothetical protein HPB51_005663 [Rhipicephalus microplus]|uniref:Lipocalin n=1 Tax=Rhipicephalus microplus TaxID=6941 RepID=A0A9J6EYR2_RHIMP|nr:hypothetical protein HPB51_005663 [Rhipicephalus microplus]
MAAEMTEQAAATLALREKRDLGDFVFTVAYRDCKNCKVFRHNYINNGAGCSYWLTNEALDNKDTCCAFVYDLLCGPEKHIIYDDSCE